MTKKKKKMHFLTVSAWQFWVYTLIAMIETSLNRPELLVTFTFAWGNKADLWKT